MSLKQSSRSVVYGDSHISTQNGCLAVLAIPGIPQVRRGDIHQRFKSWQAVHYNVQALGHTQQAGKICKGMTNDTEYPKLQAMRGSQHRTREGSAVYTDVSSQAMSKLGTYKLVLRSIKQDSKQAKKLCHTHLYLHVHNHTTSTLYMSPPIGCCLN